MPDDIVKLCECGCGQPAPIAKATNARWGHVKGQPVRFVHGHYHNPRTICREEGCERPVHGGGRCGMHYQRQSARHAEYRRRWREKNPGYAKQWYEANRERISQRQRISRIEGYGLTVEEYEQMAARGCAICGSMQRLCIDHCHATGRTRDVLCDACNTSLGQMAEDPDRLRAAADYVERHRLDASA